MSPASKHGDDNMIMKNSPIGISVSRSPKIEMEFSSGSMAANGWRRFFEMLVRDVRPDQRQALPKLIQE